MSKRTAVANQGTGFSAGSEGQAAAERPLAGAATSRLAYIDNIRIVLICLVVAGHLAITYSGESGIGDWYFRQSGELSDAAAILVTMLLGMGLPLPWVCFILSPATSRLGRMTAKEPGDSWPTGWCDWAFP